MANVNKVDYSVVFVDGVDDPADVGLAAKSRWRMIAPLKVSRRSRSLRQYAQRLSIAPKKGTGLKTGHDKAKARAQRGLSALLVAEGFYGV